MALYKQFSLNNGATSYYHRIKCIERTLNTITVHLACYTDKSYRDKEKEILELHNTYNDNFKECEALHMIERELTEDEKVRLRELSDEMKLLSDKIKSLDGNIFTNYEAFTHIVTIDYDGSEDISFNSIYNKLKEIEEFDNAEDC